MTKQSYFIKRLDEILANGKDSFLLREQAGGEKRGVSGEEYVDAWVQALHKWWKDNSLPESPPEEIIEVVKVDIAEGDIKEIIAKMSEPAYAQIPRTALKWLLRCVLEMPTSESHLFFEDLPGTLKCLDIFIKKKDSKNAGTGEPIFSPKEKNIYQYNHKSLESLLEDKGLLGGESAIPETEIKGYEGTGDLIRMKIEDATVFIIKSVKACQRLGIGSKWCTREDFPNSMASSYVRDSSDNPREWMFQIKLGDNQWFQAHLGGQVMNIQDMQVGSREDTDWYNAKKGKNVTQQERIALRRKLNDLIVKAVSTLKKKDSEELHGLDKDVLMGGYHEQVDPLQESFLRHMRKIPLWD